MKHQLSLALILALTLCVVGLEARPSNPASHSGHNVHNNAMMRDIPLDPLRRIGWDLNSIPTEPPKGTCGINSNMTIILNGDSTPHCQPYLLDLTSIFSWRVTPNTICYDTDTNTTLKAADCVSRPPAAVSSSGVSQATEVTYGWDRSMRVGGTQYREPVQNFGGFEDVKYNIFAAQYISFPRNSDPVFRSFGRGDNGAVGILGFGQIRRSSIPSWDQFVAPASDWNLHTSPLVESISSPGGPIPIWSLAMPRQGWPGMMVIGGYISSSTAPSMKSTTESNYWGLWKVTTVEDETNMQAPDMGYNVPVVGWGSWPLQGDKVTPNDMGKGTYFIGSLSNVIRITADAAKTIAETSFQPPGWVQGGAWYVRCNATATSLLGPTIQGAMHSRTILVSSWDVNIKQPDGTCISAIQGPAADGLLRLGWPFLRNTIITFNITSTPAELHIRQRQLPDYLELRLSDSALGGQASRPMHALTGLEAGHSTVKLKMIRHRDT